MIQQYITAQFRIGPKGFVKVRTILKTKHTVVG
jgi:hypothetical protein